MQLLQESDVGRILVLRINKRLGNAILLTPLLRSLHRTCPRSEIDVLLGGRQGPVLKGIAGALNVWGPVTFGNALSLLKSLWSRRYDLVIDPCLGSTSNRLAVLLSRARFRLGFQGVDQWLKLTHPIQPQKEMQHEAIRPLELIKEGFASPILKPRLDLELSSSELEQGRKRMESLKLRPGRKIAFFREATGKKRLPEAWWAEWLAAMNQAGQQTIEIVSPGALPMAPLWLSEKDFRKLAAFLSCMDLFVSCDAGPMHLASAAHTPILGIFTATDPVQYRPYGPKDAIITEHHPSPQSVALQGSQMLAQH